LREASSATNGTVLESVPGLGDSVAAKWEDRQYYLARVAGRDGPDFVVAYADGDEGVVPAEDLAPVPPTPVFNVGDHVLACWKGAKMFPGRIREKRPNG